MSIKMKRTIGIIIIVMMAYTTLVMPLPVNAETEFNINTKVNSSADVEQMYFDFLDNYGYLDNISEGYEKSLPERYAFVDIDQDGLSELILDKDDGMGFHTAYLYTIDSATMHVKYVDDIYSYGEISYSPEYQSIQYSPTRPSVMESSMLFYGLTSQELKPYFSIYYENYDSTSPQYTYVPYDEQGDALESSSISEEDRNAYINTCEYIDWKSLFEETSQGYLYKIDNDSVTITGYTGDDIELTVPEEIVGYPVTRIINYAFASNYNLQSVQIPDSMNTIGNGAFYECYDLDKVEIPDNVTNIGEEAFYGSDSLVIYGYAGSAAESYADENNILFEALSYDNPVVDMLFRTRDTLRPMDEYDDPNQIVLDYLTAEELAKMTVTTMGNEISSDFMWQEAYRRSLVSFSGDNLVMDMIGNTEALKGLNEKMENLMTESVKEQGESISSDTISLVLAGMKDVTQHTLADIYLLEIIHENATDENLKKACEQLMQKEMSELCDQAISQLSEKAVGILPEKLAEIGKTFGIKILDESSALMKGLGYTCEALGYVGTVLFVKDIAVDMNGWAEMTEAYQDVVAYKFIRESLYAAYMSEAQSLQNTENWMQDESKLGTIGSIYQYIEKSVILSYDKLPALLGNDYNDVLISDPYLRYRVDEVNALDMNTYIKSKASYMKPSCEQNYMIIKGNKQNIKLFDVRYGSKIKYTITSGKKFISVNNKGKVTAKKPGTGKIKITIQQNGEKNYTLNCNITVLTKKAAATQKNKIRTRYKNQIKKDKKEYCQGEKLKYAYADLNKDGTEELITYPGYGYCTEIIYTFKNNKVKQIGIIGQGEFSTYDTNKNVLYSYSGHMDYYYDTYYRLANNKITTNAYQSEIVNWTSDSYEITYEYYIGKKQVEKLQYDYYIDALTAESNNKLFSKLNWKKF